MKHIFALVLALLVQVAFATADYDELCRSGQESQYTPFFRSPLFTRRIPEENSFVIENGAGKILFTSPEKIIAFHVAFERIWVLLPSHLIELTSDGDYLNSYEGNLRRENLGMAISGTTLVIAKGQGGLSGFDIRSRGFKWHNALGTAKDGFPVAVTLDGNVGYAAIQSARENGFTGIMSFDVETGKVLKRSPYNYQYGVIGIDVYADVVKDFIVLNNQGWIHLVPKSQVQLGRSLRPKWIAHQIPQNGDINAHYMMLSGNFFFEGSELLGCGVYTTMGSNTTERSSKLFRVKLPL